MGSTLQYLDEAKRKLHIDSDYALSKRLGCTTSAISNYRAGRSRMDDVMAVKVAEILEKNPLELLASLNLERAKDDEVKEVWKGILEKISKGFNVLLLGGLPHGAYVSVR